ncbi:MAG: nitroreductase family deazaflavin-dependent oxidoreductase [Acidimicrobiia bacterium]|nr:nitroreductase family deazaflavin-dependent oxidoreductase [Acidimicrobiia bacterium]
MNDQVIEEFRNNGGKVGGFFEGKPLLLLHNTGARSGAIRINPLIYATDGDSYVIAASKGGADSHPDWYYNIKANPDVRVEVGDKTVEAKAHVVPEGHRRTALYEKLEDTLANFTEYRTKTDRLIPVIVLEPTS